MSMPVNLSDNLMKGLMGIITFCVTGMLGFLWRINATISVLEERDEEKRAKIDNLQSSVNQIRLNQQESKETIMLLDFKMQYLQNTLDKKNKR